mgnify:CR=1 FL=1
MLVSVIVATYNCAGYIEDALNSVYRQTYKDLELVVTDDCSTDNSIDVAKNGLTNIKNALFAQSKPRPHIIAVSPPTTILG